MPTLKVYHGSTAPASPWDNFATNAYQTLNAAQAGASAGDTILVAKDHQETVAAALTLDCAAATHANPVSVYSVDRTDDSYATMDSSTGYIRNTGTNRMEIRGQSISYYGLKFQCGVYFEFDSAGDKQYFKDCYLEIYSSNSNWPFINTIGDQTYYPGYVILEDCTMDWSVKTSLTTAGFIGTLRGGIDIINPTFVGTTVHWDSLIANTNTSGFPLLSYANFIGGDYDSAWSLDHFLTSSADYAVVTMQGCELPSNWTSTDVAKESGYTNHGKGSLRIGNSASGTPAAPPESFNYYEDVGGKITTDTTVVRTGGASDGENSFSFWMQPSPAVVRGEPLRTPPICRWISAGAQTVNIFLATTGTLSQNDVYLLIDSPNESTTAQYQHNDTRLANLRATTELADGSAEGWGGTQTDEYKISKAITPSEPGLCRVVVCLAADQDIYVDPKIEIT